MKISLGVKAGVLVFLILFLDQATKIWVKTHLDLGNSLPVLGNWFVFRFNENPGMAYGMEFGGNFGKLLLSLFRIIAVIGIGWYMVRLVRTKAALGLVLCIGLIFSGALGNILDSAFYGLIFDQLGYAHIFSGHSYASFLHGHVVDMLYFPAIQGNLPSWLPFKWIMEFIFNVADASISIGVILILLFQRKYFLKD